MRQTQYFDPSRQQPRHFAFTKTVGLLCAGLVMLSLMIIGLGTVVQWVLG